MLLGTLLVLAAGCKKEDPPQPDPNPTYTISIDNGSHTFDNEVNLEKTFAITSETSWALEGVPDNGWLEITPIQGGAGTTTLTVRTKSVNESYVQREVRLKLAGENVVDRPYLSISQAGYKQMELPDVFVAKPGTLDQALCAAVNVSISNLPYADIKELFVYGKINEKDFQTLNSLKNLELLNMKEAKVENNVIPDRAFYQNKTLRKVALPNFEVASIDVEAFRETNITYIDLGTVGLETIGARAF